MKAEQGSQFMDIFSAWNTQVTDIKYGSCGSLKNFSVIQVPAHRIENDEIALMTLSLRQQSHQGPGALQGCSQGCRAAPPEPLEIALEGASFASPCHRAWGSAGTDVTFSENAVRKWRHCFHLKHNSRIRQWNSHCCQKKFGHRLGKFLVRTL